MTATYRISEEDYVGATRLFAKFTPRIITIFWVFAWVLILVAVFGPQALRGGIIGGLIGGISIIFMARYIVSPLLARRHYRRYKAIHEEFTVDLVEGGIRFTSPVGDAKVTWDKVYKWRENEKYVLIYPMPQLYHVVPKSVAAQGFDVQVLTHSLLVHVGKAA
jgi:YcxB-like protein